MTCRDNHVCPVEIAGLLDNLFRRWFQNPRKILHPYVKPGMTVLDFGCGPGFFTVDMAGMVGPHGRVIAADLQDGMLDKLKEKIRGTASEARITLHKCREDKIGLSEKVDFVLAFYVVHEIPDQKEFFIELKSGLLSGGQVLLVEPPFHVSKSAFQGMINTAQNTEFEVVKGPRWIFSKSVVLRKL